MLNVSFFVPAYNCAATVAESVESIMETNFIEGDELVIVNDCSTDNTDAVLNKLKDKYSVMQIITHSRNQGGAAARNTCITHALNDLLFCLDSDNMLAPNSIAPLKRHLLNSPIGAEIASFQEMRYFSNANHDVDYIWRFFPETDLADFMSDHKNPGSSGNYLFTRDSWKRAGGYPEFAGALDTWGFCFRQLASGSKMIALPGSYYLHRYGTNSYYIRDMNQRNMSLIAAQIIAPFAHLINSDDYTYITSPDYMHSWFDNFDSRPIRIEGQNPGRKAAHLSSPIPLKHNMLTRVYNRLKHKLLK